GPPAKGTEGGLKLATSTVLLLFEVAERMVGDAADKGHDVLWCARTAEGRGRPPVPRLHAAPLAVSGLVRSQLLTGRTAVLTSATLSLGGSFTTTARGLGLDPAAEREQAPPVVGDEPADEPSHDPDAVRRWRGLDVGSPFDYPRSGILYVASHLPAPGREPTTDSQLDEIVELVQASGGGALGLFSSRRAAEQAAEAVRGRVDVPILCQGEDQLPTLVRRFAEDDATCLFGTLSLWQGVDVPGRSNRLVIIDRVPFPRPDDPVRSARSEAVAAAGGNGFMAVAASHAALLLAQGAGRLVRTATDRGVVAVLDPRLVTARYAGFLVRSMPPFWRTTDPALVRSALTRLAADG
ncbi:ATP-dependent helicase, partial [Cellulomonas bogoriensis 69B4 = DSM 16987]